jgi:hypothetical protein
MLALGPHRKIDVPLPPNDLRKSFDGLTGLVRSAFEADPRDGGWFLFLVSGARVEGRWLGQTRPGPSECTRRIVLVSLGVHLAGPLSSAQSRSIDSPPSVGSGIRQEQQ